MKLAGNTNDLHSQSDDVTVKHCLCNLLKRTELGTITDKIHFRIVCSSDNCFLFNQFLAISSNTKSYIGCKVFSLSTFSLSPFFNLVWVTSQKHGMYLEHAECTPGLGSVENLNISIWYFQALASPRQVAGPDVWLTEMVTRCWVEIKMQGEKSIIGKQPFAFPKLPIQHNGNTVVSRRISSVTLWMSVGLMPLIKALWFYILFKLNIYIYKMCWIEERWFQHFLV